MAKTTEEVREFAKLCVGCKKECKQDPWVQMWFCPKYDPEEKK